MEAKSIIEEPEYFDLNYLAEYAAFYSVSSWPYGNICRRFHFFKTKVNRSLIKKAAGGDKKSSAVLNDNYLGFIVLRPLPHAPLGRTVLKRYPERDPTFPRIDKPNRDYTSHLAGITLKISGVAWQQQDTGVGACATVALWSLLQSATFDDGHAVPTTVDVTRFAHHQSPWGSRVFPSDGLIVEQVCTAIKQTGLEPVFVPGNVVVEISDKAIAAFSPNSFKSACASLIRSGYPVLLAGELKSDDKLEGHAVCAVGFREKSPAKNTNFQDGSIEFLYIHDDNLGPYARFKIVDKEFQQSESQESNAYVSLQHSPPTRRFESGNGIDTDSDYPTFIPQGLITGVHEGVRLNLKEKLYERGCELLMALQAITEELAKNGDCKKMRLTVQFKIVKLSEYIEDGLLILKRPNVRSKTRLALCENVRPMSLHVGVVRIFSNNRPMVDVLYDTTDANSNVRAFCNLRFNDVASKAMSTIVKAKDKLQKAGYCTEFGDTPVDAF
ncbi:MAG: hypothetical protein NUW37_07830 [Planctomycetes bacterium]|nr:hypothetical protein [Planctomycetota bacterium]